MKKITDAFSAALAKGGIIETKEAEVCSYGLELMLLAGLEFASVLIFAVFVGNFLHTLLFLTAFLPLRIYAGGYHADSRTRCYLILLFVYGVFTAVLEFVPSAFYIAVEVISLIFTMCMVWKLAPIIHKNKTVNSEEKKAYRRISIKIMWTEALIVLIGMGWKWENCYIFALSLGQFAAAGSMLAAFVKNKVKGAETDETIS